MSTYISSFTTGFDRVIAEALPSLLPGVTVLLTFDGLIYYSYAGEYKDLEQVPFFNNTFAVIQFFGSTNLTFPQMIQKIAVKKHSYPISTGTCRVRYSKANQFAKVEKQFMRKAEDVVTMNSRLTLDRLNPETELWYLLRADGAGFYCQLLHKREATEKNLEKGELRPEFAYLLCCCGKPQVGETVYDPFCGSGAISKQLALSFPYKKLIASDIDPQKVAALAGLKAKVFSADATNLAALQNASIDLIITDPPWGYYEEIDDIETFYTAMLTEFSRILAPKGHVVLLSARKNEFEAAAATSSLTITDRINTLVNGKKASVYLMKA